MKSVYLCWFIVCFATAFAQESGQTQNADPLADHLAESTILAEGNGKNVDACSNFETALARMTLAQMISSPDLAANIEKSPQLFARQLVGTDLKIEVCETGCFYQATLIYSKEGGRDTCEINLSAIRKKGNSEISNWKLVHNNCNLASERQSPQSTSRNADPSTSKPNRRMNRPQYDHRSRNVAEHIDRKEDPSVSGFNQEDIAGEWVFSFTPTHAMGSTINRQNTFSLEEFGKAIINGKVDTAAPVSWGIKNGHVIEVRVGSGWRTYRGEIISLSEIRGEIWTEGKSIGTWTGTR